jgi:hypothetical protein
MVRADPMGKRKTPTVYCVLAAPVVNRTPNAVSWYSGNQTGSDLPLFYVR